MTLTPMYTSWIDIGGPTWNTVWTFSIAWATSFGRRRSPTAVSRLWGRLRSEQSCPADLSEWKKARTVTSGLERRRGMRWRHCLPFARVTRMIFEGIDVNWVTSTQLGMPEVLGFAYITIYVSP